MTKVERTPAGSWRVRFRHGLNKAGTAPRQTSETFATRREAERFAKWLDALGPQGALDQLYAADQEADVPTLDQLAADHIAVLTGIEAGTRETYTRLWARTWGPLIGKLPASHVTRDAIAKAVNQLGTHYSRKSLENQRGLLAGVLGRGVELGYLPKNPVKGMRLPRGQEGDAVEMRIITPEEYAVVREKVAEISGGHYSLFVDFLAGTGCRFGEAVALTVADVQLPLVRVRRALKWHPTQARTVGATKTKKSNRSVVLPPVLVEPMREHVAGKARGDLVFTAPKGGQVLHRTFWSRVWLPSVSHLEPRPRIHDLRHSHVSTLLAAGVPVNVVQARLGHESIQTTVDTYGHLMPDAQTAAASAAGLAFGAPPALSQ